jgi:hypothetical protein
MRKVGEGFSRKTICLNNTNYFKEIICKNTGST